METKELYEYLSTEKMNKNQRKELVSFLKSQAIQYNENPQDGESIAYNIAGLLGAKSTLALPDDDILVRILIYAAELELPLSVRNNIITWQKLSDMINQL